MLDFHFLLASHTIGFHCLPPGFSPRLYWLLLGCQCRYEILRIARRIGILSIDKMVWLAIFWQHLAEMSNRKIVHDTRGCIHHWIIDIHNFGKCKKCGASKQFETSWPPEIVRSNRNYMVHKAQPHTPQSWLVVLINVANLKDSTIIHWTADKLPQVQSKHVPTSPVTGTCILKGKVLSTP